MAEKDKKKDDTQLTEDQIRQKAEEHAGRRLTEAEVQQWSQAYVLWYRKTENMSKEEQDAYKGFLASTSAKSDIDTRYDIADRLYKSWKAEQDTSTADQDDTDGDGSDDTDDVGDRTNVKHKQTVDADSMSPPGVEHDTRRSTGKPGDNSAPKKIDNPFADDEKFFNALKNLSKGARTLKSPDRKFKIDVD